MILAIRTLNASAEDRPNMDEQPNVIKEIIVEMRDIYKEEVKRESSADGNLV